jgi:cytochrome b561
MSGTSFDAGRRYDTGSILLHWTIAAMIVIQIGIGWYMNWVLPDHSPEQASVRTIHISFGLTILLLVLVRILWRLTHPLPPLPAGLASWERVLARGSHVLFYVLLLALPLTGWAIVSLGNHPIFFWGMPWPKLPGLGALFGSPPPHDVREEVAGIHTDILVWITIATLALHVAGALKHQFDRNPELWRMVPFMKAPEK